MTLHDGHCTSSLVQLGASLAVLGLVRGAAGFNCYGNMACLLTYSPEEEYMGLGDGFLAFFRCAAGSRVGPIGFSCWATPQASKCFYLA